MNINKTFPLVKTIECLFCGAVVDLTRCGRVKDNGSPNFWYVETERFEGRENHECEWTLDRPEKIGPLEVSTRLPRYGPWKVYFWELKKKKKDEPKPVEQLTLDAWFNSERR